MGHGVRPTAMLAYLIRTEMANSRREVPVPAIATMNTSKLLCPTFATLLGSCERSGLRGVRSPSHGSRLCRSTLGKRGAHVLLVWDTLFGGSDGEIVV